MSRPEQPKGDALDFVRDLLADEDEGRIAELAPNALRAEMEEQGLRPARARRLVEQVLAEGDGALAQKKERLHVAQGFPERAARRVRVGWLAAAAAAAIAIAVGAIARPAIVAAPHPVHPPAPSPTTPPSPSSNPRAATLREKALAACAKGYLSACEHGLDQAEMIDPAGENDVRVREARASIREAHAPPPFDDDKPKLSPH